MKKIISLLLSLLAHFNALTHESIIADLLVEQPSDALILSDNFFDLPNRFTHIISYSENTNYPYTEDYTIIAIQNMQGNLEQVISRAKFLIMSELAQPWGFDLKFCDNSIYIYENTLYSTFFDRDLKTDAEQALRNKPYKFIEFTISVLKQWNAKNVLEIGSARYDLSHPLEEMLPCCLEGHSTFHWVSKGFNVTTIDINPYCRSILEKYNFRNLNILTGDALTLIEGLEQTFDLVFLDAWDVGAGGNYAENHVLAYRLVKNKLSPKCLILIDDTDIENFGKGKKLMPELLADGFKLKILGRQALFARE